MKEYELYCTEIGSLELVCNDNLYFKINVDYFLRSFSIQNPSNQDICQGNLRGWFFMEKLICKINKEKIFIFERNKLINSDRCIEYKHTWGNKPNINLGCYKVDIIEVEGMIALKYLGNFSDEDIILITCLLIYKYILKSPHRAFEKCSMR